MEQKLSIFCNDCQVRGFTQHTIETYKSNIRHFLQFTQYPETIDRTNLSAFLSHCRRKNYTRSTLNGYFAAISSYVDYLVWTGEMESNPVPAFRTRYLREKKKYNGKNTRQLISVKMMSKLVHLPFEIGHVNVRESLWTVPIRDHAIMMMLAKTGMRKTELQTLDIYDLDLDLEYTDFATVYIHPFAKRCNCIGFIDKECITTMEQYIEWRAKTVKPGYLNLWISHTGRKLGQDDVYYLVVFYATLLGIHDPDGDLIDKFGPHCCRHWFTTHLRRQGMERENRRWLRGDAPQGADDLYDHIDPLDVAEDYCKYIPRLGEV